MNRYQKSFCVFLTSLFLVSFLPFQAEAAQKNLPNTAQISISKLQKTAGRVGIQILAVPSGQCIYEHRSQETFIPASLVKIFTSYSALKQMGPDHHFQTMLHAVEKPRGDLIAGDVWIKSEGDPFFLVGNALVLARQLKDLGVRSVLGGIFADNSYFDPQTEQICLDGHCHDSYNPVVSATSMDFNTIVFRSRPAPKLGGPVLVDWTPSGDYVLLNNQALTSGRNMGGDLKVLSLGLTPEGQERYRISGRLPLRSTGSFEHRTNVENPAGFVARSFRRVLQQEGIAIRGTIARGGSAPPGAVVLASYQSPSLGESIYGLNRFSNNFMAEMLLRSLGAKIMGLPGTTAKGITVISKTLQEIGVSQQEVCLTSGSGLSRRCRASPRAFGLVLLKAYEDASVGPSFLSSLAVNGQEGTLEHRLLKANTTIRGKTGTLNDVVTFSGYVSDRKGEILAVTVLMNDVPDLWQAREALDAFLECITREAMLP